MIPRLEVRYVCHPGVVVDPDMPVPRWHLSALGVERMRAFASSLDAAPSRPDAVRASTECGAIEAAGIFAAQPGLPVQVHAGLDEDDRSSTGCLPPDRFQAAAGTAGPARC